MDAWIDKVGEELENSKGKKDDSRSRSMAAAAAAAVYVCVWRK